MCVSRDSLIQAGSGTQAFHRYAYVGNNPSRLTDPAGHGSCEPQVISTPSFFGHSVEVPLRPLTVCTDPEPLQVSPDHLQLPDYTDGGSLDVTPPSGGCRPTPPLDLGNTIIDPIYQGSGGVLATQEPTPTGRPTNSQGEPYPSYIDPRTGKEVPFPEGNTTPVPKENRVEWDNYKRADFIAQWMKDGYPAPDDGWGKVDIHHILPRERGGTNDFWNLVPVDRDVHQQQFSPWWERHT